MAALQCPLCGPNPGIRMGAQENHTRQESLSTASNVGVWQPYLKVIREKCSQALHILDRFHIVAKMNLALDDVRAEESRRMRREGRVPVLKKSRWLLLFIRLFVIARPNRGTHKMVMST